MPKYKCPIPASGSATISSSAGKVRVRKKNSGFVLSRGWCDYHFQKRKTACSALERLERRGASKRWKCHRRSNRV